MEVDDRDCRIVYFINNAARQVPTRPRSITEHPNDAQSIAHLRLLAPPSVLFAGVANKLTAIVGEPPIEVLQDEERDDLEPRELVWLLDLPGQVTPRWHPQLLLCEPDIEDEQELRFVQTHSAGLFELGSASTRVGESGVGLIRRLGERPGYQSNQLYSMGRSCCIFTKSVISTCEKESKQIFVSHTRCSVCLRAVRRRDDGGIGARVKYGEDLDS